MRRGGYGSASLQAKAIALCCGEESCMPTHCTTQSSWDCGESTCPIMRDTKFSSVNGIETFIGETLEQCQEICQLHTKCMSWTYIESSTLCYLYDDTVSTSSTTSETGRHSGYKCNKTFKCREGQGKSQGAYATHDYTTEAECAAKCQEDAGNAFIGGSVKQTYTCVRGQGKSG